MLTSRTCADVIQPCSSEAERDSISDLETSSEVHSLEIRDSFEDHEECFRADLACGDCGYSASEGETYKLQCTPIN